MRRSSHLYIHRRKMISNLWRVDHSKPGIFLIVFVIIVVLMFTYGCVVVQPVASVTGTLYIKKRIDVIEEKIRPDRIDSLANRIQILEWQVKALERAVEEF